MEEKKQHFQNIMLYYFKKGKKATEIQKIKDLCSVWRRFCDWSNVLKVICEVSCRNFHIDNSPWSNRPVEVNSGQIKTLIETILT